MVVWDRRKGPVAFRLEQFLQPREVSLLEGAQVPVTEALGRLAQCLRSASKPRQRRKATLFTVDGRGPCTGADRSSSMRGTPYREQFLKVCRIVRVLK